MVKKKTPSMPVTESGGGDSATSSLAGSAVPSPASVQAPDDDIQDEKKLIFKTPDFQHTSKSNNKKRAWRSLKQILHQEKSLQWLDESVHYSSIDAPPSFKPAKKYSDLSGLQAKYTDPHSKLYFARSSEFCSIRALPNDIICGYLTLRKASNPVG